MCITQSILKSTILNLIGGEFEIVVDKIRLNW